MIDWTEERLEKQEKLLKYKEILYGSPKWEKVDDSKPMEEKIEGMNLLIQWVLKIG